MTRFGKETNVTNTNRDIDGATRNSALKAAKESNAKMILNVTNTNRDIDGATRNSAL